MSDFSPTVETMFAITRGIDYALRAVLTALGIPEKQHDYLVFFFAEKFDEAIQAATTQRKQKVAQGEAGQAGAGDET